MDLIYPIIAILIGAVMLLFGFKIFRFWLALSGLFIGALIGLLVSMYFPSVEWLPLALAIGLGILFALLAYTLYKIAFIVSGAVIGAALLAYGISLIENLPDWSMYAAYIVGAIIGGFIAVKLMKPYIIIVTALDGALVITAAVYTLINGITATSVQNLLWETEFAFDWLYLAIFGGLAVLGCVFQFIFFRHRELDQMKS